MGTGVVLLRLKRQGCEAERSLPSTAEVKIGGDIPPLHKTFSSCAQLINCRHCIDFYRSTTNNFIEISPVDLGPLLADRQTCKQVGRLT